MKIIFFKLYYLLNILCFVFRLYFYNLLAALGYFVVLESSSIFVPMCVQQCPRYLTKKSYFSEVPFVSCIKCPCMLGFPHGFFVPFHWSIYLYLPIIIFLITLNCCFPINSCYLFKQVVLGFFSLQWFCVNFRIILSRSIKRFVKNLFRFCLHHIYQSVWWGLVFLQHQIFRQIHKYIILLHYSRSSLIFPN